MQVRIGRLPFGQLDGRDAQRPYVRLAWLQRKLLLLLGKKREKRKKRTGWYFWIVGWLFDDFGRHPEGRAYKGVALASRVGQLAGHAEIRQFDVSLLAQQHVGSCLWK